jgi:hypothetical protein
MALQGRLELGKSYNTHKAGVVKIVDKKMAGRKIFTGELLNSGQKISYFRNGRFSNASVRRGGHAWDIVSEVVIT